jgi:2-polyprenyl-3-methyl-5-hydroxy-6-metoxy-1,4-benzoquinol methylase
MVVKAGWFDIDGRPGDRTVQQQIRGLDSLWPELPGKTVLDVGCAEGLISFEAARAGAVAVHGVEIVRAHIAVAQRLRGTLPCTFTVANADDYKPVEQYDVVLLLAVLHKLQNPYTAACKFAAACKDLAVIRLPPQKDSIIRDWRTKFQPFDIGEAMTVSGFSLHMVTEGPNDEWTGFFRRSDF